MLGYIAAGEPSPVASQESWASAEPVDTLELPEGFLGKSQKDVYALRVKGTSMIDALVDDGDVVIVQPVVDDIQDGDMVVAWLQAEQEVTLKRLYQEGDRIRLQPANSTMSPIYVDRDNLEVHGKVVGSSPQHSLTSFRYASNAVALRYTPPPIECRGTMGHDGIFP